MACEIFLPPTYTCPSIGGFLLQASHGSTCLSTGVFSACCKCSLLLALVHASREWGLTLVASAGLCYRRHGLPQA